MLIFAMQKDESVICKLEDGREIELTFIEMLGNQAKVGLEAHEAVEVARRELSPRPAL